MKWPERKSRIGFTKERPVRTALAFIDTSVGHSSLTVLYAPNAIRGLSAHQADHVYQGYV